MKLRSGNSRNLLQPKPAGNAEVTFSNQFASAQLPNVIGGALSETSETNVSVSQNRVVSLTDGAVLTIRTLDSAVFRGPDPTPPEQFYPAS
ncbi:hypothetical protein HJFPF1_06373 [Paramyrothecium foliicola]|nr:hypothetical protein HJFPF1_06373 [Paramyrothecium foliicola]